jgi:DNA-binding NtrC family response regulator
VHLDNLDYAFDRRPATAHLLIGQSPPMASLKSRLPAVARVQRTTLIVGPTGSGKDLVARTLHELSVRRGRPFVTVHCAALPETLVEAEMFGHCRGAFTGATQTRAGLVRSASGGTLFLDEIDSLPASAQAKLLRFLETGEYRAVGADRPELSDAWVIAATNQDLHQRVAGGSFRADLLYRLAVVRLEVPPLVERDADSMQLAEHFLTEISSGKRFDESARRAIRAHAWPGNVRELKHRVESAALLTDHMIIDAAALGLDGERAGAEAATGAKPKPATTTMMTATTMPAAATTTTDTLPLERELWSLLEGNALTLSQVVGECERLLVQAALRAEQNNRTRAAGRLGIHVRTIFKKLTD